MYSVARKILFFRRNHNIQETLYSKHVGEVRLWSDKNFLIKEIAQYKTTGNMHIMDIKMKS